MRLSSMIIFIALFFCSYAHATIGAGTVWEIRTTGSSNNAGGYDSGVGSPGTDLSTSDSASYTFTDLASTSGTTNPCVVTSASHNFVSNDNGNFIHITAGTSWTTGFYEIISTSGNAATLDRACAGSATVSGGTYFVGGAYKFASSALDTTFVAVATAGNKTWFGPGTHTTSVNLNPTVGTATALSHMSGYNVTRGDNPTGSNRPTINLGSAVFVVGFNEISNLIFKSSATSLVQLGNGSRAINLKVINNTSNGSARIALNCTSNCMVNNVEAISWAGTAMNVAANSFADINGSYFHDSLICVNVPSNSGTQLRLMNSIMASCTSQGLNFVSAPTFSPSFIINNTFYGQETPISGSTGLKTITGSNEIMILNNIFYGWATGMANPDANSSNYNDYNDFSNNTADITTWGKGSNSKALAPQFANVTNIRGTTATSSAQILTDSGANFSGITDNVDTFCITATTGGNSGCYLITAHTSTTITADSSIGALGTGTAITYVATLGHNFAIGTNLKAQGFPGAFQAGLTTSYLDIGGVQRVESGSGYPRGRVVNK